MTTVDKIEIEKFSKRAEDWWNPNGEFKPLHLFNPARIKFIKEKLISHFKLDATNGAVVIKLVNSQGESISITKIETTSEGTTKLDCTYSTTAAPVAGATTLPLTVSQGNQGDFTLAECDLTEWSDAGFTIGQKGKVGITVTYHTVRSGANFPHQIKGDIFATVQ